MNVHVGKPHPRTAYQMCKSAVARPDWQHPNAHEYITHTIVLPDVRVAYENMARKNVNQPSVMAQHHSRSRECCRHIEPPPPVVATSDACVRPPSDCETTRAPVEDSTTLLDCMRGVCRQVIRGASGWASRKEGKRFGFTAHRMIAVAGCR